MSRARYIQKYDKFGETSVPRTTVAHESKMRLLKPHLHASQRRGYEALLVDTHVCRLYKILRETEEQPYAIHL